MSVNNVILLKTSGDMTSEVECDVTAPSPGRVGCTIMLMHVILLFLSALSASEDANDSIAC